jgi:NAD(P)-dependent dehydrogenase (short-subunit alcohol dehydrogenase family)
MSLAGVGRVIVSVNSVCLTWYHELKPPCFRLLKGSIEKTVKSVSIPTGHLDTLITNAGLGTATAREQYRAISEMNVFGLEAVTESFFPIMEVLFYSDRRVVNVRPVSE